MGAELFPAVGVSTDDGSREKPSKKQEAQQSTTDGSGEAPQAEENMGYE